MKIDGDLVRRAVRVCEVVPFGWTFSWGTDSGSLEEFFFPGCDYFDWEWSIQGTDFESALEISSGIVS